jgi:hypothetical protein
MKRPLLLSSAGLVVLPGAGPAFPHPVLQTASPSEIRITFPDCVEQIFSSVALFGSGGGVALFGAGGGVALFGAGGAGPVSQW